MKTQLSFSSLELKDRALEETRYQTKGTSKPHKKRVVTPFLLLRSLFSPGPESIHGELTSIDPL